MDPLAKVSPLSIRVKNAIGTLGIAKPGARMAGKPRLPRSSRKAYFDLAHVLELPVPPVILWSDGLGAPYVRGRSISAWAFPQAMKWQEAESKGLLSVAAKDSVRAQASAMRVFHTWISDTDRKSEHTQINLDSPDGELGIAFIDHAFAMFHVWNAPNHGAGRCAPYMPVPQIPDVIMATCARISGISDAEMSRLVNRIPIGYLPEPNRGHILSNLLARKGRLRAILGI